LNAPAGEKINRNEKNKELLTLSIEQFLLTVEHNMAFK